VLRVTNNIYKFEMQSKSGEHQKPFRFGQGHELFEKLSSLLVTGMSAVNISDFFSHGHSYLI